MIKLRPAHEIQHVLLPFLLAQVLPSHMRDTAPISLVTLAAELDEHPGQLAHRLGDEVFIELATGLRCVTVETCKRLLDERRELHEQMARRVAVTPPRQPSLRLVSDPDLEAFALRGFKSGGAR